MTNRKPDRGNVKRILANVEATMAVEGIRLNKASKATTKQYLTGSISREEAVAIIHKRHARNFGK